MKITKRQLKRIIKEEYSRLKRRGLIREMTDDEALKQYQAGWDAPDADFSGSAPTSLSDLEDMVANEVEDLLVAIQEEHSLEGEGISMDELNMAIARGVDRAKAVLRY